MEQKKLRTMITFKEQGTRFTFRVAGIVTDNGRVLFQYADGAEPFWYLPGGRAELNETAEETLQREIREELGMVAQVGRLLYIVENLFTNEDGTHHEIGFYFLMTLPETSTLYKQDEQFVWEEGEESMQWRWLPIEQLPELASVSRIFAHLPTKTSHSSHTYCQ